MKLSKYETLIPFEAKTNHLNKAKRVTNKNKNKNSNNYKFVQTLYLTGGGGWVF